ncbi:MAG: hypothetical protein ACE5OZ_07735 [Candidatus Heimdallarchaeota archaeon]
MNLVLEGEILTPIITKKREFLMQGCKIKIVQPKRRYFNKINSGKPMFPYSYVCYLGKIELRSKVKSKQAAKRKIKQLLEIEAIGKYTSEGMGLVKWLSGRLESICQANRSRYLKVKIRKGLPRFLSIEVQKLIQIALLHDFFHTSKHRSKIYVEPQFEDLELAKLLREHHGKTENCLLQQFQRYDRLAAIRTRQVRSPRISRYNWTSKNKVDFQKLARQISEANKKGVWTLYKMIYENEELEELNESLQYGHSSLKRHILLIANLIVQDFISGKMKEQAQ